MNARSLIFDFDGTLIDSASSILSAYKLALDRLGIAPGVPLTPALIGPPMKDVLPLIAGSTDERVLESLASAFREHYDTEGYKATIVFPGVEAMFERLSASGISLHVATNKRGKPTASILAHLGWDGYFKSVYSSDMREEPISSKGELLRLQLEEQAIDVGTAAYVGDRLEDGRAADENGLAFYMAVWGYTGGEVEDWPRHWIRAHSPGDLS